MQEQRIKTFIDFRDMRDILAELESQRIAAITTKVHELIATNSKASRTSKLDGMSMAPDKKDGGKDCGTDGKENKEGSDNKEACDPGSFQMIYGDPANIPIAELNSIVERKAARLQALLSSPRGIV